MNIEQHQSPDDALEKLFKLSVPLHASERRSMSRAFIIAAMSIDNSIHNEPKPHTQTHTYSFEWNEKEEEEEEQYHQQCALMMTFSLFYIRHAISSGLNKLRLRTCSEWNANKM